MLIASQVVLGIFALLLAVGGVIGFRKAGSRPSLIAGLVSGVLALAALGATFVRPSLGLGMGLVLAVLMAVVFAIRLRKTGKFMPSGMLLAMSTAVGVVMAVSLYG